MQFIDLKKQYEAYKDSIDTAIMQVVDSCKFIFGPEVYELEEQLAQYAGVKHAITTANGTDSLIMALMALGIGPGDEVITTPFTFIAPPEVVAFIGATPVFVDIDPDTFLIDIESVKKAITPKTKAIIPVSIFGQMADIPALMEIAEKHGIHVIEDGAQSFGAERNGKKSCSTAHIGSTSFFPAKPLGCYGDGGAVFTNDDYLADQMKAIRNHGGQIRYQHERVGFNARLDTIQAAILIEKLKKFPEEIEKRFSIGEYYNKNLKDYCQVPKIDNGNSHIYALYTIRSKKRDAIEAAFKEKGIPYCIYYPHGLYEAPVFSDLNIDRDLFPKTNLACSEVISIPMHPFLDKSEQDLVIETIQSVLK